MTSWSASQATAGRSSSPIARTCSTTAGLAAPTTFEAILAAATALNKDGTAGIVAATGPADSFTQQTFEYFALANGCQLTDDAGAITLDSQQCVDTFKFYTDLITKGSVAGVQDADTTRAAYFAGDAAMVVWSSFLLDELAGLRNDALPTCDQCKSDPLFLANNTGIVTGISGPERQPDPVRRAGLVRDRQGRRHGVGPAVRRVHDERGLRRLARAPPEGKFPTRLGTADNPTEYADAWGKLEAGVDTKKPLGDIYPADVVKTSPRAATR